MGYTQDLVDAVIKTRFEDIPDDALGTAKACLLDTLGVALAGCRYPLIGILSDVIDDFGGAAQATILGRGRKASVPDAALINGTAAHALDFDDMHIASAMHPSAPVISAALAVAEHVNSTGAEFLRAVCLGIEVATRIGEAVNPTHYKRGWHATATLGHFGAATAVSILIGLDRDQMVAALGIAGTQAAGLKESFGTMTKPLHAGHAARNGVMACYLAARGFTSATQILEGERGFGYVMSDSAKWDHLLDGWGVDWSLRKILYKPHVSSFCTQALIEGVLGLRRKHKLNVENVRAIRGAVSHFSIENARVGAPRTGLEAKFSLTHAAAQALAYGQAAESDFTDERAVEPKLSRVRELVSISLGQGLGWPEAVVEIDTIDGSTLQEKVDLQLRTAGAQNKWAVVEPKFRQVTAALMDGATRDAIVQCVNSIDHAKNVRAVGELAGTIT